MKRFVVFATSPTPSVLSARIVELANTKQVGWWHHVEHAWLFADPDDTHDCVYWRKAITLVNPNVTMILVTEVEPREWAGKMNANSVDWLTNAPWIEGPTKPLPKD